MLGKRNKNTKNPNNTKKPKRTFMHGIHAEEDETRNIFRSTFGLVSRSFQSFANLNFLKTSPQSSFNTDEDLDLDEEFFSDVVFSVINDEKDELRSSVLNLKDEHKIVEAIFEMAKRPEVDNDFIVSILMDLEREHPELVFNTIKIEMLLSEMIKPLAKPLLMAVQNELVDNLIHISKKESGNKFSYLFYFNQNSLINYYKMPIQNAVKTGYDKNLIKGNGSSGKVVVAYDMFDKELAVKIQKRVSYFQSQDALNSWQQIVSREASFLNILNESPHHVNVLFKNKPGYKKNNTSYIIEHLKSGETLDTYLSKNGIDSLDRLSILVTLCKEVHRYHSKLIAHCDIKPDNIIVKSADELSLIDPGLAVKLNNTNDEQKSPFSYGHCYHPTEFVNTLKLSIDIYSIGIIAQRDLLMNSEFIKRMCIQNESAEKRPTIEECTEYFSKMLEDKKRKRYQSVV